MAADKPNVKLQGRWYEFTGYDGTRGRKDATEAAVDDMRAAAALGIPFTVTEHSFEAFRNGGNVTKAKIRGLYVKFGEDAVAAGDPTLTPALRAAQAAVARK